MNETGKIKLCPECGGAIQAGHTQLVFDLQYRVQINNVSANVCSQCGEAFVNERVAADVDRLVNRVIEDVESFAKTQAPNLSPKRKKEISIAV